MLISPKRLFKQAKSIFYTSVESYWIAYLKQAR